MPKHDNTNLTVGCAGLFFFAWLAWVAFLIWVLFTLVNWVVSK